MNATGIEKTKNLRTPIWVLLVEDSKEDAQMLIRLLRKGGYEPIYSRADTAESLREMLHRSSWDIVITDYEMPGFGGPGALSIVKEMSPNLPILVLSGAIEEDVGAQMVSMGANDFVTKQRSSRLIPAIGRALKQASIIREWRRVRMELAVFRRIVDNCEDMIFHILPQSGWIMDANRSACRRLGYTKDEFVGLKFGDVVASVTDATPWRKWFEEIDDYGAMTKEVPYRRKDGTILPVNIHMSILGSEESKVVVAIAR